MEKPTKQLISCAGDVVSLWDLTTHQLVAELTGHKEHICAVKFYSDTKALSAGNDCLVIFWDVKNCEELARFSEHKDWISTLVCFPVGLEYAFATASYDSTVKLWSIDSLCRNRQRAHHRQNNIDKDNDRKLFRNSSGSSLFEKFKIGLRKSVELK
jgi:WD40 repeat protein